MPSLVVGDTTTPILHVSQLAAALGLPVPPSAEPVRIAWETLPLLRSWLDRIRPLDLEALTAPTQSRGRSLRNLTVNVFHPFELLSAAWTTHDFPWDPDRDDERERTLQTPGDVAAYAEVRLATWTDFVLALGDGDPLVSSPRGELRFSTFLESQRDHVSFHHAQLVEFLACWAPSGPGIS